MNPGIYGAIAASQRRKRRRQEELEEERMTRYRPEELEGDWEFKIVRSEYASFRKPEKFQRLVDEEALAGWEFLEKLDDSRVRFKRPKSARRSDAYLPEGTDPYRTNIGGPQNVIMVSIAVGLVLLLGFGIFAFTLFSAPEIQISWPPIAMIVAGLIVLVSLIAVVIAVMGKR